MLFTPGLIGTLELPNRLIRSATAEKMADEEGRPLPKLGELYLNLAKGGVSLIITGHLYISEQGKCHPEMTGIHQDTTIPDLSDLTKRVHEQQGKIIAQLNHGGGNCSPESVPEPIAPSVHNPSLFKQPPQKMTLGDIEKTIEDFGRAARRAQKAGFDGVQIHAAHGYLVSQFISPLSNQREDQWGGSAENRIRFLNKICQAIRSEVGQDFPMLIKFGMADGIPEGLTVQEGADIISHLNRFSLDAIEISTAFSGKEYKSIQKGIQKPEEEGYLLPLVKEARPRTDIPIISVGGYRSRKVMERVLLGGWADFISLSRPLIREPDLPRLFQTGKRKQSDCISANNCWPESKGEGIDCKCPPLSRQ